MDASKTQQGHFWLTKALQDVSVDRGSVFAKYSGKLLRERNFINFVDLMPSLQILWAWYSQVAYNDTCSSSIYHDDCECCCLHDTTCPTATSETEQWSLPLRHSTSSYTIHGHTKSDLSPILMEVE